MGAKQSQQAEATPITPHGTHTKLPGSSGEVTHALSHPQCEGIEGGRENELEVRHTAMLIPDLPSNSAALEGSEAITYPVDESSPLLPLKMRDSNWRSQGWGGGATASSAAANLTTSIIGVGMMGLPATLKIMGIPLGVLCLLSLGLLSEITVQMLLKHSRFCGFWSYADLLTHTRGSFMRGVMRVAVIIGAWGGLVIFLIVIGDVLSGTGAGAHHHFGVLEDVWGPGHWAASRLVVLSAITLSLLFPLCMLERIDSLKVTSALSIVLAMGFVFVVLGLAGVALAQGRCHLGDLHWLPAVTTWEDWGRLCSVLPTIATAYVCHQNVHPIYVELHPPRWEKMRGAARSTFALCTAVYTLTAVAGYLLFGEGVMGDVLANFDEPPHVSHGKLLSDGVRLSYALHLMLVFPVVHYSMRASMSATFFPEAPPLGEDRVHCAALTGGLLVAVLAGAVVVPNIEFAFQVTGSLSSVTLAFTLPGLIALSPRSGMFLTIGTLVGTVRYSGKAGPVSGAEQQVALLAVVLGIIVSLTGLGTACYSIYAQFLQ